MIIGIGVDICSIERIEKICAQKEAAFLKRLLAVGENCPQEPSAIAKRYAAKEAVSKALGCGIGAKLSFQDITLNHHESGQPYIMLSPKAQQTFTDVICHISISDDAGMAIAYVVAEKKAGA